MKRTTTLILLAFLFAISVVLALHIATPKKANLKHASFDRFFSPESLQLIDTLNLNFNSYYFAGMDSTRLYLGNSTAFGHIVEINVENLRDTTYHKVSVNDILAHKAVRVRINPPYFYLTDGITPFIYRGNTRDWKATSYIDSIYFVHAVPILDSSVALLGVNRDLENTFYKVTKGKSELDVFPELLEKQGNDGLFSTDGILQYDKRTKRLIYVFFYRNQYLYMDTNFNLLYKGNTIDSITQVKIKVDEISSENKITMSSPPLMVNKNCHLTENLLYIHSNILAKNEDIDTFENSSVIDMYDLKNSSYKFSFYIPAYKENKMSEFIIEDNIIIARHGQYLVSYRLK
ncbi:hypothetical protein LS482_16740 [Sinomicrobium kalidii]|uniref:hypothetical protein n=1 Tax=Sinomicrobium kalidii TaxID=2900738 RepID=UPI001E44203E|nr:hypothetical protein [Sinomicrobium kalidii]UGU15320.1 hypothetical protein LS482_16740 [Sinomicrobium kalidii]